MKNCGSNYAKSDSRSKEEIRRLQSANDALTAALKSARPEYPTPKAPDSDSLGTGELDGAAMAASQGNLPPTEYPKLPSHTNFADTPAANKVAAQNVGLQATAAPNPQPLAATPKNPAFNVPGAMPDLSALDEAYRRMGRGG